MGYIKKYRRIITIFLFSFIFFTRNVYSVDVETYEALNAIGDFADRICTKIPLTGSGQSLELSGEGKMELKGLLKKIAGAGIAGSGEYQDSDWEGVLQKDLIHILDKNVECKLKVFEVLQEKILPRVKESSKFDSANSGVKTVKNNAASATRINYGKVVEVMHASGYTYMLIDNNSSQLWVIIPETEVALGNMVTYKSGMTVKNFESRTLGRTFDSAIFSSGLLRK